MVRFLLPVLLNDRREAHLHHNFVILSFIWWTFNLFSYFAMINNVHMKLVKQVSFKSLFSICTHIHRREVGVESENNTNLNYPSTHYTIFNSGSNFLQAYLQHINFPFLKAHNNIGFLLSF